ncbi:MAG: hypothetical protein ABI411_04330 [Tahibacter sp.]
MTRISPRLLLALGAVFACGALQTAQADVLLMQRVQQENSTNLPARGMAMTQVESRYGAPTAKLNPAGGDSARHPVINRWEYDNFIVYFERDRVISSVVKRANGNELGPKQAH